MNRREFFRLLTAAVIIGTGIVAVPIALAATDPRAKAWKLFEESNTLFNAEGKSPAYLAKTEELFAFMDKHFLPPKPTNYNSDVQDVRTLLKHPTNFDLGNCSDATFCVVILRHGLKTQKLPMIQASNWKMIARPLTKIVMAA